MSETHSMRCFHGVTVALETNPWAPATASGSISGNTAKWVPWSRGDLHLDIASFAMVFSPIGNCVSKPLGCLMGATMVEEQGHNARTYVIQTNDPMHNRLMVELSSDANTFESVARSAELNVARRCASRASMGACTVVADDGNSSTLHRSIREQHSDRPSLIFDGAELYGPDPYGQVGSEVLIARGCVVLVDPPAGSKVGAYEILFYEEPWAPVMRTPIGPRTILMEQPTSEDGPALVFDFSAHGEPGWSIAFDRRAEGTAFARDFQVRQQLLLMAFKTSRGGQLAEKLQEELLHLRRSGVVAIAQWLIVRAVMTFLLAFIVHGVFLLWADPHPSISDAASLAWQDILHNTQMASQAGCQIFAPTMVPEPDVKKCIMLSDNADVRNCLSELVIEEHFHTW